METCRTVDQGETGSELKELDSRFIPESAKQNTSRTFSRHLKVLIRSRFSLGLLPAPPETSRVRQRGRSGSAVLWAFLKLYGRTPGSGG